MENKIRSTLNEIYFGKTKDVVNDLRYSTQLVFFHACRLHELIYCPGISLDVDNLLIIVFVVQKSTRSGWQASTAKAGE